MINRLKALIQDRHELNWWIFELFLYSKVERSVFVSRWGCDSSDAHHQVIDTPWFRFFVWRLKYYQELRSRFKKGARR